MSELCYIITENYPDDRFGIEHEYKHSEFELAKKDFIEFSKEKREETIKYGDVDKSDILENEDYYLVECDKEKLKTYIQSSDLILERIKEIVLDQVETDDIFSKEDREKAIEILENGHKKLGGELYVPKGNHDWALEWHYKDYNGTYWSIIPIDNEFKYPEYLE